MNREQKAALVEELAAQIRASGTIFAVDYRGLSVAQAADLRARLRDSQTRLRVVKNSLTERASDAAGAEPLKAVLEGPTALAFVAGDAALAAKTLSDAGRSLGTLEFKGGLMDGAPLSAEQVRAIARLPAREVLHGQLVGMVAAPLSGLVRGLNALIAGLAIQLRQIVDQRLAETDGAAPGGVDGAAPEGVQRAAPEGVERAEQTEPQVTEPEPSEPEATSSNEAPVQAKEAR